MDSAYSKGKRKVRRNETHILTKYYILQYNTSIKGFIWLIKLLQYCIRNHFYNWRVGHVCAVQTVWIALNEMYCKVPVKQLLYNLVPRLFHLQTPAPKERSFFGGGGREMKGPGNEVNCCIHCTCTLTRGIDCQNQICDFVERGRTQICGHQFRGEEQVEDIHRGCRQSCTLSPGIFPLKAKSWQENVDLM